MHVFFLQVSLKYIQWFATGFGDTGTHKQQHPYLPWQQELKRIFLRLHDNTSEGITIILISFVLLV